VTLPRPTATGWRDGLLFLTGLGLIVNEAVIRNGPERPTLLLLYAAMVGLPAFLRQDERRANGSHEEPPTQPKEQVP
jgi:hypothetical protein